MLRRVLIPVVAASLALAGPALAQKFSSPDAPAAKPGEAKPADDNIRHVDGGGGRFTLPLSLYNEKADAAKDIADAAQLAKKDNRRVLVMWGENRCEFCAYLNEMLTTNPQIRQLIETEYVWVKVDIGKFDKNIDLAHRYNTPIDDPGDPAQGRKSFGAPALTVVEPASGQAIGRVGGNEMVNQPMIPPDRVFNADFVFNFLEKNKPQPKAATMLAADAQQKAKRDGKRVLMYFNIYGSDACKAFDRAVNRPEAASLLEKAYVLRKIDVERHIAGWDMLRRLKGSQTASPPWMIVTDETGNPVADAGKGLEFDTDHPEAAADWLVGASGGKLTGADRGGLVQALTPPPPAPKQESNAAPAGGAGAEGTAEAKK